MNNELEHHGILGMHWGVRRFQNPDGSLTPAGRRRYDEDYTTREEGNTLGTGKSSSGGGKSSSSSELTPEEIAARSERRKEIAKKVAIGVGVAAAVAGAAYLGTRAGMKMGEMNAQNSEAAKNLVSTMSNTPTSSITLPSTNASNGVMKNPTADDIKSFAIKQETPQMKQETSLIKVEAPREKPEPADIPQVKEDKTSGDYKKAHSNAPASELSTKELADAVARLNLEKKYNELSAPKTVSGKKKVANIMRGASTAFSAVTPVLSLMGAGQNGGGAATAVNTIKTLGAITGAVATIFDLMNKNG